MLDLIIIGAGPSGISAAIYAKSRGLSLLVLEKNKVGGIIGKVSTVTHYSGIIESETGESFSKRLEKQAVDSGVEIRFETVKSINLDSTIKEVVTDKETYKAKAIILANGSTPRKLNIPGEKEHQGNGIGLNAPKDANRYEGKNVYVVGGADGAVKEAIYLAKFAKKVTIIHFENQLGCINEFKEKVNNLNNIELLLNSRLVGVSGKDHVSTLTIKEEETNKTYDIHDDGCGIFIYAGLIPNVDLVPTVECVNGYIKVNEKMETSVKGVYAVGDITNKQVRQVATAVSDGAIAGVNVASYIKSL